MNRIDWIMLRRLTASSMLTLVVIFSVFALVELLDYPRFLYMMDVGGLPLAMLSLVVSASRWTVRTMSVTLLIGVILGMVDLQARQELNIIRASGASVWRAMRAPLIAAALFGAFITLFVDTTTTQINRSINPSQWSDQGSLTPDGAFWLEQEGADGRYIIRAGRARPSGTVLDDVTVFLFDDPDVTRVVADQAVLEPGAWRLSEGTGYRAGGEPQAINGLTLATTSSVGDVLVRLASTNDLTFFELLAGMLGRITDPILGNAVATRLLHLSAMPALMMSSVVMGFAFTSGYRKTNKYGQIVLYGIVLGFVVLFITEMADRAGTAGALNPVLAAVGPALFGLFVGLTVLLYREDGRA